MTKTMSVFFMVFLIPALAASGCGSHPGHIATRGPWQAESAATGKNSLEIVALSTSAWQNFPIPVMTGPFVWRFDAIPNGNMISAITSLSSGAMSLSNPGAVIVRFDSSGKLDAVNGSGYAAVETIPYSAGTLYHFEIEVNLPAHSYTAVVTSDGGLPQVLAENYAFASAQATVSSLNNLGVRSTLGSHSVFQVSLSIPVATGAAPAPAPTPSPSPQAAVIRVACGKNGPYTDSHGNLWSADTGFTGGVTYSASPAPTITGTGDAALYQSERYGADASANPAAFSYGFSVPNGSYTVNLKFAEMFVTAAGQRLFDVAINGDPVLSNFDIFATAGGQGIPVDEQFTVNVTGGQIQLQFSPGSIQNPKVDAIEIVPSTFGSGQTSFLESPAVIPGTIQAINFDNGGQNVAYSDATPGNTGGAYRQTDVDIKASTDASGGFAVGWMATGEWMTYSVNVAKAGRYSLSAQIESATGGAFHVEMDGNNFTGSISVPNTGSWDTASSWQKLSSPAFDLAAGHHVMKVVVDSQWLDLESLSFTAGTAPAPSPSPTRTVPAGAIVIAAGSDIQSVVNSYGENTVFLLKAGAYSGQTITPRNGDSFYGEFINGRPAAVLDGGGGTSERHAFIGTSASNVTIDGLKIQNYVDSPTANLGTGVFNTGAWKNTSGWVIRNCEIAFNTGAGVGTGNNMTIQNNSIHDNGWLGIRGSMDSSQILIDNNEIYNNNTTQLTPASSTGFTAGLKLFQVTYVTVSNNKIYGNYGIGLWFDTNWNHIVVENNEIFGQRPIGNMSGLGLFMEIGLAGGSVTDNRISGNYLHDQDRGLVISTSSDMDIHGNAFGANGVHSIDLWEESRGTGSNGVTWTTSNVSIHDNWIAYSQGNVSGEDLGGFGNFLRQNVTFTGDTYYTGCGSAIFLYDGAPKSASQWQALGLDLNSVFNCNGGTLPATAGPRGGFTSAF